VWDIDIGGDFFIYLCCVFVDRLVGGGEYIKIIIRQQLWEETEFGSLWHRMIDW